MKNEDYVSFLQSKQLYNKNDGFEVSENDLNPMLFDFQKAIVRWALRKGRAAIFADCGLGKTPMQLEWASVVQKETGLNCLILAPLAVSHQTQREGEKFGVPVNVCRSAVDVIHGINITNYERLDKYDVSEFGIIVLDESSILKAYTGKRKQQIITAFHETPYKLACTATPAPNDYMELGNHSEFLNVLTRQEMLTAFFINDTSRTQQWRLKGHATKPFWQWMCSWSIMIKEPTDIGFNNDGFVLPELKIVSHVVEHGQPLPGRLFKEDARTLDERRLARKTSIKSRTMVAADLINQNGHKPWLVWCNLNDESKIATNLINHAVEITGSHELEYKEEKMMAFSSGNIPVLVTKPKIAGFGMNWQHCSDVVFLGLSDSYESFYQAIRRCWRFGQTMPVTAHIITADIEGAVVENIRRKEVDAEKMHREMVDNMADITKTELGTQKKLTTAMGTRIESGQNWTMYEGDCVEITKNMDANSIDFSIFSPPFASLFSYSDSERDMGNSRNDREFFEHLNFLIPQLYRVMVPGRLMAIHCMNLPCTISSHGHIGIRDFRGDIIRAFQAHNFIFHSEVCIWKDPLLQAVRTKMLPLAHKQICKDSTRCGQGFADYLVIMRKPGENPVPVSRRRGFEHYVGEKPEPRDCKTNNPRTNKYSHKIWQRYASPVWFDIRQTNTLNVVVARTDKDEKHVCPLQLDVIERAVELWTNPGELVFSPFAGIGSEGYVAIKTGRKFVGIELKSAYFDTATNNLKGVESWGQQRSLFAKST